MTPVRPDDPGQGTPKKSAGTPGPPTRQPRWGGTVNPSRESIVERVHLALEDYVRTQHLGRLWTAPMEVVLDHREGIVLRPDIIFVTEGRESIVSDHAYGPPDMVLEVTSLPSGPGKEKLEQRVGWCSVYGVREYWLIHPEQREVAILELAHGGVRRRTLLPETTPLRSPMFPTFERSLAEILA